MLSRREAAELVAEARRNEVILRRLDKVEDFLLGHHGLAELLTGLGPLIASVYQLESAGLVVVTPAGRLPAAIAALGLEPQAGAWQPAERSELRLLLGELERPFLTNHLGRELVSTLFGGQKGLASAAVIPLWVRGELLGTLCLGSASPGRYRPGLETDFLRRLGRKISAGLDAALFMEQGRLLERREAAVEMAGAACHNLAQPLTTATLLAEKLKRGLEPGGPAAEITMQLAQELERMGELVQGISQVSEYVTKPYAEGLRIIDLDAAGTTPDRANRKRETL